MKGAEKRNKLLTDHTERYVLQMKIRERNSSTWKTDAIVQGLL